MKALPIVGREPRPSRSGRVLYRGPSMLDGAPIVMIATGCDGSSENSKTGPMVQLTIIRSDVHPSEARRTGADVSVCGTCVHRPMHAGTCYVGHEWMLTIWRGLMAGDYPDMAPGKLAEFTYGRPVRIGAYGDPLAVPLEMIQAAKAGARRWSGYTHAWSEAIAEPRAWRGLVMASVETIEEREAARADGWRTFRIRGAGDRLEAGEVACPHRSHGVQCERCGLCNGKQGDGDRRADVVEYGHGIRGATVYGTRELVIRKSYRDLARAEARAEGK